jgi:hypothetical protein
MIGRKKTRVPGLSELSESFKGMADKSFKHKLKRLSSKLGLRSSEEYLPFCFGSFGLLAQQRDAEELKQKRQGRQYLLPLTKAKQVF